MVRILEEVKEHTIPTPGSEVIKVLAGGSVANTIRGLSGGLKVPCSIVGARGDDDLGQMFQQNLEQAGVDLSSLRVSSGSTGQVSGPTFSASHHIDELFTLYGVYPPLN